MKYYIQNGDTARSTYYINKIVINKMPVLFDETKIKRDWINFSIQIIDDLCTDFNFYKFFCETMPNMPSRFYFVYFSESILAVAKLLDDNKENKIGIFKILNNIEQNISVQEKKEEFVAFKNDIIGWLKQNFEIIDNIKTVRDKFIAHLDINNNAVEEWRKAIRNINEEEFIKFTNFLIEVYNLIITNIKRVRIPDSQYKIDEFKVIYENLRSLDRIEKNVTIKNMIIHNIDLDLQKVKKLIE